MEDIQVFTSEMHYPVPQRYLHREIRLFHCSILGHKQYHHCRCGFGEMVTPCSCEKLQTVSCCCCFWSLPLLLHETATFDRSTAAQPALTSSLRKQGTGDPLVLSRGAELGTAVLELCHAALGRWHLTVKEAPFCTLVRAQHNICI